MLLFYESRSNYTVSQTTVNAECTMIPSHLATDRRELFTWTPGIGLWRVWLQYWGDCWCSVLFCFIFHYKLFIWYTTFYCSCLMPRLYAILTHFVIGSECLSFMGNKQKFKYSLITKQFFFNYNFKKLYYYSTSYLNNNMFLWRFIRDMKDSDIAEKNTMQWSLPS